MNMLRNVAKTLTLLLFLLAAMCLPAQAQSLIWRNDWTVQAPPTFEYFLTSSYFAFQQQAPVVISEDGELLMRAPALSLGDDQIIRFTAAGAVRWRANNPKR